MSEQMPQREYTLANGLSVTVTDVSRHYYGGYWQVALEASCLVGLETAFFDCSETAEAARRLLGDAVPFVRRLERMAVHGEELDAVREELLQRIERHLLGFLAHERFPERFIQTEFQQRNKRTARGFPCLV